MDRIANLRTKIDHCINIFIHNNHQVFPNYAILTSKTYGELGEMKIYLEEEKYLSHDLGSERIEILTEKDLQNHKSMLEKIAKTYKFPFILSKDKKIDNKDIIVDLSKELDQIEEESTLYQ